MRLDDAPCVEVSEEVKGDEERACAAVSGTNAGGWWWSGGDLLATIAHPYPPSRYSEGRSSSSSTATRGTAGSRSLFSSCIDPVRFATPSGRS